MNLQEELEKAFIAGADFMREETVVWDDDGLEMPIETEVMKAAENYINKKALVNQ